MGAPSQLAPIRREVFLYADGSCTPPRGVGGWAYLIVEPETGYRYANADSHPRATNNRMELMAVVKGLQSLSGTSLVHLVVDSEYVSRGLTEWLPQWLANGWRAGNRRRRPLKNKRLWRRLASLISQHEVDCHWVPSHSGHPENEFVDSLARDAVQRHMNSVDRTP